MARHSRPDDRRPAGKAESVLSESFQGCLFRAGGHGVDGSNRRQHLHKRIHAHGSEPRRPAGAVGAWGAGQKRVQHQNARSDRAGRRAGRRIHESMERNPPRQRRQRSAEQRTPYHRLGHGRPIRPDRVGQRASDRGLFHLPNRERRVLLHPFGVA